MFSFTAVIITSSLALHSECAVDTCIQVKHICAEWRCSGSCRLEPWVPPGSDSPDQISWGNKQPFDSVHCEPGHGKRWPLSLDCLSIGQYSGQQRSKDRWLGRECTIGGGFTQHYTRVPSHGSSEISVFFLTFARALRFLFYSLFALLIFILAFRSLPLMFNSFHRFLLSFRAPHRILPPSTSATRSHTASDACSAELPKRTAESQTEFVSLDSSFLPHGVRSQTRTRYILSICLFGKNNRKMGACV